MNRLVVTLLLILALVNTVSIVLPIPLADAVYTETKTFFVVSMYEDGYITNDTVGDYPTARNSTIGDVSSSSVIQVGQTNYYQVLRGFLFFNTTFLGSSASISSATLEINFADTRPAIDDYVVIQDGQPTYPHNPLVSGDYDRTHYSGDGGKIHFSDCTEDEYNSITLNTDGISWLNKTGITKLCLRSEKDINGTAPAGAENVQIYAREDYISRHPRLIITASKFESKPTVLVDVTNEGEAISRSFQHKLFWVHSKYWAFDFQSNLDNNGVCIVSSDGQNWTNPIEVDADGGDGVHFSIAYDNGYFHFAKAPDSLNISKLCYRRALANENGTLSFTTDWQTILTNATDVYYHGMSITVDSDGYPWIGYEYCPSGAATKPYVIKSEWKNGSWSNATGFPYELSSTLSQWSVIVTELTASKMYVVYAKGGDIYGQLWSGSAWGSEEHLNGDTTDSWASLSAISNGDTVHLVYRNNSDYQKYREYQNGNWKTEVILGTESYGAYSEPVITVDTENILYVFWIDETNIYMIRKRAGHWEGSAQILYSDYKSNMANLHILYPMRKNSMALIWAWGNAPKSEIRFRDEFDVEWTLYEQSGLKWYFDRFTMWMGIGGFLILALGPVLVISAIKKGDWDNAFLILLGIVIFSFAFIIAWLWP